MREYPVPFSAREEAPFMAGLTVREMLWLGGGFIVGLAAAALLFVLFETDVLNMILCLPIIVPFVLLGYCLARKRTKEDDKKETLDRHYYKLFRYRRRSRIYLNFRRGGV